MEQIDLIEIAKKIYLYRKRIILSAIIFGFIGLLFSFLIENKYKTNVEFVSISGNDPAKSTIGGLASLAGISIGNGDLMSSVDLSPVQYPEIISSIKFKKEILNTKLLYEGKVMTFKEIMTYRSKKLLPSIKRYTLGLPSLILKYLNSNSINDSMNINNEFVSYTLEEKFIMDNLDDILTLDVDQKDGSINLTTVFYDPTTTAQLNKKAFDLLQKQVIDLKIKQSKYTLDRTEALLQEKKKLLYIAQSNLASFKDKNNYINTSIFQNQLLRLQTESDNATAVYQQVAAQVEQAKLDISKNTPIFSVLQPIEVPLIKESPKRVIIFSSFIFLGLMFQTFHILFRIKITNFFKMINS